MYIISYPFLAYLDKSDAPLNTYTLHQYDDAIIIAHGLEIFPELEMMFPVALAKPTLAKKLECLGILTKSTGIELHVLLQETQSQPTKVDGEWERDSSTCLCILQGDSKPVKNLLTEEVFINTPSFISEMITWVNQQQLKRTPDVDNDTWEKITRKTIKDLLAHSEHPLKFIELPQPSTQIFTLPLGDRPDDYLNWRA